MDTLQKLQLLSDASQYDLACACGTNDKDRRKRGTDGAWLYPVSLPAGGSAVMLKTLMSNTCVNDCKYCPYRETTDVRRCAIGPDEMATIFLNYVRKNDVFGLFLSSGVVKNPDHTMHLLNDTAQILRTKHKFKGYIHLKVIPGASDAAIEESLGLANAVSLNIETPGVHRFTRLSSKKDYLNDIIHPLQLISKLTAQGSKYSRVKKTTQFIVGASDETDAEIVKYTTGLYDKLALNRVYFSAYQRGLGDSTIPGEQNTTTDIETGFVREHRLYQVDFLLRKYSFTANDIYFDKTGALYQDADPKMVWARHHPELFPINVNHATKDELLKVPGIGPESARKIMEQRKKTRIRGGDELPIRGKRRVAVKDYLVF
jgi:predicted DNA-binding helix-hairpin-helix protein